jgi:hypothetical protein
MPTFERRTTIPVPARDLFDWHARPGAFERLVPPWESVEVLDRKGTIRDGDELRIKGPFGLLWLARHEGFDDGRGFKDRQIDGPFAHWLHEHRVEPAGDGRAELVDALDYGLPLAPVSDWVAGAMVRARLERMFRYRHRVTRDDLVRHARRADAPRLDVAVSGSTGMVGSSLVPFLTTGGHRVRRLVRGGSAEGPDQVDFRPRDGSLDAAGLEGVDAVVHLAGANIAGGRWTDERKDAIRRSRTEGTALVARTLAQLERKPRVLICASASGIYGDRGDEIVDDQSAPGDGFLADVVKEWEAAADPARDAGIRVVHLRFGVILDPRGGALGKMLPAFRLGAGGPIGSGRQWMPWVALDDVVDVVHEALWDDAYHGPVDVVSPKPVRNADFARTLGKVLRRPAILPAPVFALELVFGKEMVRETLTVSTRVRPRRLEELGFTPRFSTLEDALRHLLGRG